MSIVNLIVHEVQKEAGNSKAMLIARADENPVDGDAEQLAAQVTHLFNRSGMNTGQFSNPEGSESGSQLPALLHKHFDGEKFDDFAGFSKHCASEYVKQLETAEDAEGGLLWFNHYIAADNHFLFIVLLKRKSGITLGDDLSFAPVKQLETDKLHMALRINLTAYHAREETRYIAFRFGKAPKSESEIRR